MISSNTHYRNPAKRMLHFWRLKQYPIEGALHIETYLDPSGPHFMYSSPGGSGGWAVGIIGDEIYDLTPYIPELPEESPEMAWGLLWLLWAGVDPETFFGSRCTLPPVTALRHDRRLELLAVGRLLRGQPARTIANTVKTLTDNYMLKEAMRAVDAYTPETTNIVPFPMGVEDKSAALSFVEKYGRFPINRWERETGNVCHLYVPRIGATIPLANKVCRFSELGLLQDSETRSWCISTKMRAEEPMRLNTWYKDETRYLAFAVDTSTIVDFNTATGLIQDNHPVVPPPQWDIRDFMEKINIMRQQENRETHAVVQAFEDTVQRHVSAETARCFMDALSKLDCVSDNGNAFGPTSYVNPHFVFSYDAVNDLFLAIPPGAESVAAVPAGLPEKLLNGFLLTIGFVEPAEAAKFQTKEDSAIV